VHNVNQRRIALSALTRTHDSTMAAVDVTAQSIIKVNVFLVPLELIRAILLTLAQAALKTVWIA
jgi:hypothetical protein